MTTERDALNTFQFWCDRAYALEKMLPALAMRADGVGAAQHLRELRRARVAKSLAHEELRAIRGRQSRQPVSLRHPLVRHPPVKLDLVSTRRSVPRIAFATSSLTVKSVNQERREISGWATVPEPDHLSDIVEPRGAEFVLPIKLLHQHQHDAPIGHVTDADVSDQGIQIKATLAKVEGPGPLKDRVDTAWQEIQHGLVSNLSIGFKPVEWSYLEDKSGGIRYTRWRWLELSTVTIPAQPRARITVAA